MQPISTIGKEKLSSFLNMDAGKINVLFRSMRDKYTEKMQVEELNKNYKRFLNPHDVISFGDNGKKEVRHYPWGILRSVWKCMEEENYNVFSNTVSAASYKDKKHSLEWPHNSVHLALGMAGHITEDEESDNEMCASGDIAANETAAFDPIFYLHHAYIGKRTASAHYMTSL